MDTTSLHCGFSFNMTISQNQVDANACVEVLKHHERMASDALNVVPFHHMFNHFVHKKSYKFIKLK
jgi:hypothetical protein